jgi:hypothetical protein
MTVSETPSRIAYEEQTLSFARFDKDICLAGLWADISGSGLATSAYRSLSTSDNSTARSSLLPYLDLPSTTLSGRGERSMSPSGTIILVTPLDRRSQGIPKRRA